LTCAATTPSVWLRAFSIRATQPAQVTPVKDNWVILSCVILVTAMNLHGWHVPLYWYMPTSPTLSLS
jgi:hypothetical protein